MNTCGGCKGLGSHQRWCPESVGPIASMRGRQAQAAEDLGDAVGANHYSASNLLYEAAALLKADALRLAEQHQGAATATTITDDITMSHVPGMLTK